MGFRDPLGYLPIPIDKQSGVMFELDMTFLFGWNIMDYL